ncbi:phenylalanyl-tRNA synthetase beta subunit [Azomonas agilis]|uniref:Phenylalanine--tRNA ligase beta subunit n=1 Tax=Azomonas agilis TaxID=116849 RepID=A0A562J0D4_9GAMM|nr:phenylalanine--tRNA ligase subunit beta [Azomonas agilis]TWH76583.1 phenylalanyl-tRNA synthetase beta subunit [Azomonas agilis]
MKFSEQWLRTLVNPPVSRDELVARLSMAGLEVEEVTPVAGAFSGVVVAEVLSVEPHPDADKLRVCQVSNAVQTLQIVCGAPNVRAGLKVPLAQLGANLPGDFKIKPAKLRGVESQGMLCAASELQLVGDYGDGLLELPNEAPVGQDLRSYLNLDDVSIELSLTPNRGDCLSLTGLAREVGALYSVPWTPVSLEPVPATHDQVCAVEVLNPEACPRYLGRVVRNVDLSIATPNWMKERLSRSGVRSIDAVVDITNYVMLELGQPMHAFDLAEIQAGIRVRLAEEGEPLRLLDGQEIKLRSDTLVIADHQRALAIAGVMGGEHSGVSSKTRDVLLESAFFDPVAIAGKARSYGLHTDSSHRFERGVDFQLARHAMERATALMVELLKAEPGPIVEQVSDASLPKVEPVVLRSERINQVLGLHLESSVVEQLLTGLGLGVTLQTQGQWLISVPSHRFDISIEEDLIEELGRLYDYDRLPIRYPQARLAPTAKTEARVKVSDIRRRLVARGYQEAITYSFIDQKLFALFEPEQSPLVLANPISADLAAMRSSLWPGLVKALQHNLNRQQSRVRLFETGLRFKGQLGDLKQESMLAGLITGSRLPESWANAKDAVDFYDLKADVESILSLTGSLDAFCCVAASHPALHPGQSAQWWRGDQLMGYLGALHPELLKTLGIDQPVYVFELELAVLEQGTLPRYKELSRFPEVRRDLALVVDEQVAAGALLEQVRSVAGEYLTALRLFDVYQGKGIEPGQKSLALGLTWQHPSRTLNDEEIAACMQDILGLVTEQFGATLRI